MAVAVWTWQYEYPLRVTRRREEVRLSLGSGNDIQIQRGIAWTHATAYGTSTASYKEVNIFSISMRIPYDTWDEVCGFLEARVSDGAAFYFYNAHVNPVTSTWTGDTSSGPTADYDGINCTNVTGRHLVRQFGDVQYSIESGRMVTLSLELEEVVS